MSYSRSLLLPWFTCSSVRMSVPTSQFVPPSPVIISLFSTFVILFLLRKLARLYHFLHIQGVSYGICLSLTYSLSMTVSRSIHSVANGMITFFYSGGLIFHYTCVHHIFLICFSVNVHLIFFSFKP